MWIFRRIKWFFEKHWYNFKVRCERFKRGYAYADIWNMDGWFIHTVEPMLRHLRKTHFGYPCVDEAFTNEDWENILDQMIYHLHLMDEDNVENELFNGDCGIDGYLDLYKVKEEHREKFFELFSKYFYCLWD